MDALRFLTEDGPRPEFAELYEATVIPTPDYVARTWQNAMFAEASIWFGTLNSPGSRTTHKAAAHHGRPVFGVIEGKTRPADVEGWIRRYGFKVLNVAGNRESSNPGIGERTERFMVGVFRKLDGV